MNNSADMITKQKFKNIAKEPSFFVNDTKFNEKTMQLEIILETDIEIKKPIKCLFDLSYR